jgi:D-alanyl-D-alanine carboxypeptidase/D-alanyl-D-alanine-endopeptidase (penicillin-binding protein 4)
MKTGGSALRFFANALLAAGLASGLSAAVSAELPTEDLARRVAAVLGQPGLRRVELSACVVRCVDGEIIYEKNPHLALMPASNMKVVTSAAALESLGRDFAFSTRVGLCGEALVVIGSGDPLFGYREIDPRRAPYRSPEILQEIVYRLKGMGIASVSDIILDTSIFDGERVCPTWPRDQLRQRYACEVGGINYNGNCVGISASNLQGRVVLSVDPPTDYIKLINSVTVGTGQKSWFSVEPTDTACELLIQGNCRTQAGPYSVAVENPALFFGALVRESLGKAGIAVTGRVFEDAAPQESAFRLVAEYQTSLADCLQQMNKNSLGLAAEALFKRLGARANPADAGGSWGGGRKALTEYLRRMGVDDAEFTIADGSGLSRENRLSASALTHVLMHLAASPDWDFYRNSLAVGGVDGTLETRFWEPLYRGRVQAKSGYIEGVRSLSGVVHTDGGDYVFSFVANRAGGGARAAIDNAVKAIMDWGAGRPAAVRTRARAAGKSAKRSPR